MKETSFSKKVKLIFWAVATLTCMIIIFVMSHQPAVISADISGSITEWPVVKVFLDVFGLDKLEQETQEHIIRKLAHMLEYFGLSMCVTMYLLTLKGQLKIKTMLGALGFSVTYAISDEVHQLFVEGRAGMVKDVLIDSIGILLAIGFIYIINVWKILKHKKRMRK